MACRRTLRKTRRYAIHHFDPSSAVREKVNNTKRTSSWSTYCREDLIMTVLQVLAAKFRYVEERDHRNKCCFWFIQMRFVCLVSSLFLVPHPETLRAYFHVAKRGTDWLRHACIPFLRPGRRRDDASVDDTPPPPFSIAPGPSLVLSRSSGEKALQHAVQ